MLVEAGVIVAVAAGTLAQAVSGLGQALVAGPILILVAGAADGVRIALLVGLALNLAVVLTRPRSVQIGPAVRLFAPAVLALIPLALLVSGTSSAPLRVAAGVAISTGAALLAFGREWRWLATPSGTAVAGGVSGAMQALAATGGPVAALYAANAKWPPAKAVPTLQAYFAGLNLVALSLIGLPRNTGMLVFAGIGAGVGLLIGFPAARRVPDRAARPLILTFAAAGGFVLIITALT